MGIAQVEKSRFLTNLKKIAFESIVGRRENSGNTYRISQQCVFPVGRIYFEMGWKIWYLARPKVERDVNIFQRIEK